jgi:hypothetical protein
MWRWGGRHGPDRPGLAGVVAAVTEGRIAFQRLLTYAFNMLVKKIEIVLFLAIGLALTGHAILTPALMVLVLITNVFSLDVADHGSRHPGARAERLADAAHHRCARARPPVAVPTGRAWVLISSAGWPYRASF